MTEDLIVCELKNMGVPPVVSSEKLRGEKPKDYIDQHMVCRNQ